jgi:hypothetical protein
MQGRGPAFAQDDNLMTTAVRPLAGPPGLELNAAHTEDAR